jgi:WD40 repeat protein
MISNDGLDNEASKMKPINLLVFDRLHRMVSWELKQTDKVMFKGSFKGLGDISHFICIPKSNLFITCYLDEVIRFYNFNMEYISDFQASHIVQFIRYNENMNALILVGVHQLTVYSISGIAFRESGIASRDTKITLSPLNHFSSPFGREQWIKAVVLQEKTFRLSVAIETNLVVYDYSTGKIIENIIAATERPITCIQYHHFYGYTLLGTTNGQGMESFLLIYAVKVLNLSYATVFNFNHHPKEITGISVYPKSTLFLTSSKDKTFRLFDLKTFDEVYW